jgi:hypothetical protein
MSEKVKKMSKKCPKMSRNAKKLMSRNAKKSMSRNVKKCQKMSKMSKNF